MVKDVLEIIKGKFVMTSPNQDLIDDIEILKNILVTRATTWGNDDDKEEYKSLRIKLINNTDIKEHLPKFIKSCRNLDEFWGFIKPLCSTYNERRNYIRTEFDPLLSLLEDEPDSLPVKVLPEIRESIEIDYTNENQASLIKQKHYQVRKINLLEEQISKFGSLHVPVHLVIELQDEKAKLTEIESKLAELEK